MADRSARRAPAGLGAAALLLAACSSDDTPASDVRDIRDTAEPDDDAPDGDGASAEAGDEDDAAFRGRG